MTSVRAELKFMASLVSAVFTSLGFILGLSTRIAQGNRTINHEETRIVMRLEVQPHNAFLGVGAKLIPT